MTSSPTHLELRWDHLLFSHKQRVITFVQPDSVPKGAALLVNTGVARGNTRPKIRTVFTAKALASPENCWFPPPPSSSSQHQALAHCQMTASSEEAPLNFLGCFPIWSNHVPSPDRILWIKSSLSRSECSKFPLTFSGLLNSQHAVLYFWSTCGHRLVLGTEHCKGEWQRAVPATWWRQEMGKAF